MAEGTGTLVSNPSLHQNMDIQTILSLNCILGRRSAEFVIRQGIHWRLYFSPSASSRNH